MATKRKFEGFFSIEPFYLLFIVLLFNGSLQADVNSKNLALLVNQSDPESIEIARYYQAVRMIPQNNIINISFNANAESLTELEFSKIQTQLENKVSNNIQAYVLAWRKPWKVGCMSITSAFTLGFNKEYCAQGCKVTKAVDYYNSQSGSPYTDYAIRPSMMLSAGSVAGVKRLIDRGVAVDYSRPVGSAYLLSTSDRERNVRAVEYPLMRSSFNRLLNIELVYADAIKDKRDVMFYFTGLKNVKWVAKNTYVPGAIADHLTSTGGHLFNGKQMSVLEWIDAGVTGSYGAVIEPCNFRGKFPKPGIVMQKYLSGDTLLEAYWKSVLMPGQGVFVGEPLASPFKGCEMGVDHQGRAFYMRSPVKNYVNKISRNCN